MHVVLKHHTLIVKPMYPRHNVMNTAIRMLVLLQIDEKVGPTHNAIQQDIPWDVCVEACLGVIIQHTSSTAPP